MSASPNKTVLTSIADVDSVVARGEVPGMSPAVSGKALDMVFDTLSCSFSCTVSHTVSHTISHTVSRTASRTVCHTKIRMFLGRYGAQACMVPGMKA